MTKEQNYTRIIYLQIFSGPKFETDEYLYSFAQPSLEHIKACRGARRPEHCVSQISVFRARNPPENIPPPLPMFPLLATKLV